MLKVPADRFRIEELAAPHRPLSEPECYTLITVKIVKVLDNELFTQTVLFFSGGISTERLADRVCQYLNLGTIYTVEICFFKDECIPTIVMANDPRRTAIQIPDSIYATKIWKWRITT